jgi:sulfane dehydrogenase subunit SoxC
MAIATAITTSAANSTKRLRYTIPTRAELIANRGTKAVYHFNAITGWGIAENGEVKHVYA